jgi:hypothetical protein
MKISWHSYHTGPGFRDIIQEFKPNLAHPDALCNERLRLNPPCRPKPVLALLDVLHIFTTINIDLFQDDDVNRKHDCASR